jgi:hypothetical protein
VTKICIAKNSCLLKFAQSMLKMPEYFFSLSYSFSFLQNNLLSCWWCQIFLLCPFLCKICNFAAASSRSRSGKNVATMGSIPF